jgi:hypothetical protein
MPAYSVGQHPNRLPLRIFLSQWCVNWRSVLCDAFALTQHFPAANSLTLNIIQKSSGTC